MSTRPRHLLSTDWSRAELAAILEARQPAKPLCPVLGDPFWRGLRGRADLQHWWRPLHSAAVVARTTPPPKLTLKLYASFYANGERFEFEGAYFGRRNRIAHLAMAALLDEDPTPWLPALWRDWEAMLGEESWALPAHTFVASGVQPEIIDLMAAETMNLCGELLDLFADAAPADLVMATRRRLARQIDLFLGDCGESKWGWFQSANNWNAVCHQGVVGATLAAEPDSKRLAEVLLRASRNLPKFLEGFTPDGGCSEGPGYWAYGFGRYAWLSEQLEHRTCGALTLMGDNELVRRVSGFGARMSLHNGGLVNFSDNQPVGLIDPGLLRFLAAVAGDPVCAAVSERNYALMLGPRLSEDDFPTAIHHVAEPGGPNLHARRLDVFHYTRLLRYLPAAAAGRKAMPPEQAVYPELQVAVFQGEDADGVPWALAAKGGHNDEHHNHNDIGSFIYRRAGVSWISEIGAPLYTKDFFMGDRYRHLAARSVGHSVPVVNGHEQNAGRDRAASRFSPNPGKVSVTIDFADAYPAACGLVSLTRSLRVEAGLIVRDSYEMSFGEAFESAIITEAEAESLGDSSYAGFRLRLAGRVCHCVPLPGTRADLVEEHRYFDHAAKQRVIRRLVFRAAVPSGSGEIGFRLIPQP